MREREREREKEEEEEEIGIKEVDGFKSSSRKEEQDQTISNNTQILN